MRRALLSVVAAIALLAAGAVALASTTAANRRSANVTWMTARPSWERVPRRARVATISSRRLGRRASNPRTVTGATFDEIVKLVDALPAAQPGAVACPNDSGPLVSLVFRRARSGAALATVVADGSGCGGVTFRLGDRQAPALTGGPTLIKELQLLLHTSLGLT